MMIIILFRANYTRVVVVKISIYQTMRDLKMTKVDLAEILNERHSYNKKEAIELVELTLDILKDAITTEGHLKISGFGNFEVRQKADRSGRNPQTGETITISSRKVLTFKPSSLLKSRINKSNV
jgi:integration host factor subunit alpha